MDALLFVRGLLIGLSIAAPVGPIGVLCIRRTLTDGRLMGFATGLGAAVADALYGAVAAFGLTAVTGLLVGQQRWLALGGGLFLLYLGLTTFRTRPAERAATAGGTNLVGAFASTVLLTLTNPTTILSFVAIFAALGLGASAGSLVEAVALVLGVFLGSALWWLLLSSGVGLVRRWLTPDRLVWINRLSGLIILSFGLAALLSLVL